MKPLTLDEAVPGRELVVTSSNFDCLDAGERLPISWDGNKAFVFCREGKHFLDAQVNLKDGLLIGLELLEPFHIIDQPVSIELQQVQAVLKAHKIAMNLAACGCCGSPWLKLQYKGKLLIDQENANLQMIPNA